MKRFSLPVIGELGCEDGFYVFGVGGEYATEATGMRFDGPAGGVAVGAEEPLPALEVAVVDGVID